MGITVAEINELRKQTGAGMMDCKKALTEAEGNIEEAIAYLRKKGQKVSELRAGRETTEGAVIAKVNAENNRGIVISLGCETDFVAKNESFVEFAHKIADLALTVNSMDELRATTIDGISFDEKIAEQVARIGEKLDVKAFETLEADTVVPYIHAGNKIGVLVALNKNANDNINAIGRDVAMQVAAMNPIAVNETGVPAEVVAREKDIAVDKAKADGKPENIVEKIAEGSVKKYLKENTLVNQAFVKDGKKTVSQVVAEVESGLEVVNFTRVSL
jgi:elongation factor Ts